MRTVAVVAFIAVSLLAAVNARPQKRPQETPPSSYTIEKLYHEIREVVQRHYPGATSHRLGATIHFEHDTRVFIIHEQLKTGEWQDPWEVRGPKRDGVLGDLELVPGEYGGAAMAPQDFDKRYFKERFMAPYSKRLSAHLRVNIRYPSQVPAGFLDELGAVVNDFDRFVDKGAG